VRRTPAGSRETIHELPEGHIPDGLKIDVDGNLWITTVTSGGIDIVAPDGRHVDFLETDGVPLNCVFGGSSLYVCDFGVFDTGDAINMFGRLLKVDVGVEGMPLYRGAIA
jgi:gluconolactonase